MFHTKVAEKIKTHIFKILFGRLCQCEKYGRASQATDDNTMLHREDAICMPDN